MKPEGKLVWAARALRMESMAVNQVLRTPESIFSAFHKAADVCAWRWWVHIRLDREHPRQAWVKVLRLQVSIGYRKFQ